MELSSKTSCGLCLESLVGKAKGHRVDENLERFIAEVFPSNVRLFKFVFLKVSTLH